MLPDGSQRPGKRLAASTVSQRCARVAAPVARLAPGGHLCSSLLPVCGSMCALRGWWRTCGPKVMLAADCESFPQKGRARTCGGDDRTNDDHGHASRRRQAACRADGGWSGRRSRCKKPRVWRRLGRPRHGVRLRIRAKKDGGCSGSRQTVVKFGGRRGSRRREAASDAHQIFIIKTYSLLRIRDASLLIL